MADTDIRTIAAIFAAAIISKMNFTGQPSEEAATIFIEVLAALEKKVLTTGAPRSKLNSKEGVASAEIYHSENGDRWFLCRGVDGHAYIEHRANIPSGGNVTSIEIGDFLGNGRAGPEHRALLELIASSVEKMS